MRNETPFLVWALIAVAAALMFATTSEGSNGSQRGPSLFKRVRRWLIGRPIHSKHAHHEKLGVLVGLPVFASDALSSVAYATEAILSVLALYAATALHLAWPITLFICALIVLVGTSYRQTIYAYPQGGGSYIVASKNLGMNVGLVAGAALMIDYVLTVAVSISAGVVAITSIVPALHSYITVIAVVCVGAIAWANLRGMRESGAAFAIPTYAFVGLVLMMCIVALFKTDWGATPQVIGEEGMIGKEAHFPYLFILLRAFAAGCTALTGIEAVSDGVQAFRDPSSKNAAKTLGLMTVLLTTLFLGIGAVALHLPKLELYATKNPNYTTVVSQIASHTFGHGSALMVTIQVATALILILAANTAFADFPRLAGFLARDGFLPRSLQRQGDRLVFQNGIIMLAIAASALVWVFHGELDLLLPLYAVGVFTAFTLSQFGMVKHWLIHKSPGWRVKMTINGIGAFTTFVVAMIILVTKFSEGAWLVAVLILILIGFFVAVRSRYQSISRQLSVPAGHIVPGREHTALVLVPRLHKGVLEAIDYGYRLHGDVRAVHITLDPEKTNDLSAEWRARDIDMPLVILNSPYRSLIDPILDYVDEMLVEDPQRIITVIVAEPVSRKFIHRFLHESITLQIKLALGARRNVVVSTVRYFLD